MFISYFCYSGELMSTAAKDFRALAGYICGRKVDLSVRVYADHSWDNEIAVNEFKIATSSDPTCLQQQRKSVRSHRLSLDFYTLRRYEDILGADRSTLCRVWLPRMRKFLKSDSLHVLLTFGASQ
ncbi:hypothetical protein BG004_007900 [Podila humilis]|nr:hypothetical protein BG004_007900 [Podila humilis]